MLEKFLERLGADQRGQRNPLLVQVLPFADSLMESGYAADLPRFSHPAITGVSRFRFVGEYISPPS